MWNLNIFGFDELGFIVSLIKKSHSLLPLYFNLYYKVQLCQACFPLELIIIGFIHAETLELVLMKVDIIMTS